MDSEEEIGSVSDVQRLAEELAIKEAATLRKLDLPETKAVKPQIRKRRRRQDEVLEENRKKFMNNFATAYNSGSDRVMEKFIYQWCKPDIIYREQFVHFVPNSVIYREVHGSRLFFQYLAATIAAIPDCVFIDEGHVLKSKRDGSAYVVSTVRYVGQYTFRIVMTNCTHQVKGFLTRVNPMRSVMDSARLFNRVHFKSFFKESQQFSNMLSSAFPPVYHTEPVQFVGNFALAPKRLIGSAPAALETDETVVTIPHLETYGGVDLNSTSTVFPRPSIFDEDDFFVDIFTALMAEEEEASRDESEQEGSQASTDYHTAKKRPALEATLSKESITSSTEDVDSVSCAQSEDGKPIQSQTLTTSSLQNAEDASESDDVSRLSPVDLHIDTLDSNGTNKATSDDQRVEVSPTSSASNPTTPSGTASSSAKPSLPTLLTPDLVKVSTPYSQFFLLERFPRAIPFDFSFTYIAYYEPGSDQVGRLDVYKKDNLYLQSS